MARRSPGRGRGGARERLTDRHRRQGSSAARAALHMLDKPGVVGRAAQEGLRGKETEMLVAARAPAFSRALPLASAGTSV